MGIEPTNGGTTNHCLNHLATLAVYSNYTIINFNLAEIPENLRHFASGLELLSAEIS
jgi:hypothetical protein